MKVLSVFGIISALADDVAEEGAGLQAVLDAKLHHNADQIILPQIHPIPAHIDLSLLKKTKTGPTIPIERSPLECSCPDTYQLFGERCERIVERPQDTICPPGSEYRSGICVRTLRAEEHCPYGYALVNNECVKRNTAIPKMTCPDGYTLEASAGLSKREPALVCVRQIAVDTILECPNGIPYNGSCSAVERVPALFACPPGYEDHEQNTCRRTASVPCTAPHHEKFALTLGHGHGRILAEEEGLVMTRVPVANHDINLKSIALPTGLRGKNDVTAYHKWHQDHHITPKFDVIEIDQTCVATITIPAVPYCTTGELRGRFCHVQVPANPVEICPAYGTPANCFAFDRINPFAACPDGYNQECSIMKTHIDSYLDCECISLNETTVELICPTGYTFEDGLCVLKTDPYTGCTGIARPVDGKCQTTETTPAMCSYTVSYQCEGPHCGTTVQKPVQHLKPLASLAIKKF